MKDGVALMCLLLGAAAIVLGERLLAVVERHVHEVPR